MTEKLSYHSIYNYHTHKNIHYPKLDISYALFGKTLHTAPILVVIHALTGNSDVASKAHGWWSSIIGEKKVIDTSKYTVISFNILGNGYKGKTIETYKDFNTKDIASLFLKTLYAINIHKLHAIIGGSLGGSITWEMASLAPSLSKYIIPIASDWKTPDWIIAHNYVQDQILRNSKNPVEDARMMAMLFYRTPASLTQKFNRTKSKEENLFKVESWLKYHGEKLKFRYDLLAYKTMNHLLTTIDIRTNNNFEAAVENIKATIIQIGIDSDLFFIPQENINTHHQLNKIGIRNQYHQIESIHGHDAFLIEDQQLSRILKPFF